MQKDNKKLQGKDFINVGIFGAIYFVIAMAVGMLGYIPVFVPLFCVITPIIGGVPFMLFLTKVKKFGMIWLLAVILGLFSLIAGMGYYALLLGLAAGLLAELVYRGESKSIVKAVFANAIFGIITWGNVLPIFLNIEAYFATRGDFGKEYIDALASYTPSWMCFVLLAACFVSGIIGGLFGQALLKKHFRKVGIA